MDAQNGVNEMVLECKCGHVIEVSDDCPHECQICGLCGRMGCFNIIQVEWMCKECNQVGKYSELNRSGGVDCCPDCRTPVVDVEGGCETNSKQTVEITDTGLYPLCPKCGMGNITRAFSRCIDCGVKLKWKLS